ncbi:MAG: hypothetical protein FWG45_06485 [Oscillospiraceae bacterium]|nr:hypothetical protein [Oscillospiraceae bacterium]
MLYTNVYRMGKKLQVSVARSLQGVRLCLTRAGQETASFGCPKFARSQALPDPRRARNCKFRLPEV